MISGLAIWSAALALTTSPSSPAVASAAPGAAAIATNAPLSAPTPLTPAQAQLFWGSPEDVEPKRRAKSAHFWAGNEARLYVFEPVLRNLGGAYVGVGSDQAFLFIGWQRPQLAWLTDYDSEVRDVMRVHRQLLLAADTPRRFIRLWRGSARPGRKILQRAFADHPERKRFLRIFRQARRRVGKRLIGVRQYMRRRKVPCYLTDQGEYDFVRAMLRTRRVRPMLTNLLADRGLTGVAEAARKLGVTIRAIYLSNAEEYWSRYPAQYQRNVAALPFDDRSLVLRTNSYESWHYAYYIQPAKNYVAWLAHPKTRRWNDIKSRRLKRWRRVKVYRADFPPPP